MNKKAFSLIEVLISVSIIIILAIVATTTSNNLKNNSNNSKIIADLNTIENALVGYKTEMNILPKPNGNVNNFQIDGKYNYSFEDENTFGIYGMFTENTLEKRFLDITPLDPRTNQYYSYGITKESKEFELAGVVGEKENYIAKLVGNYNPNGNIHSLIREYNGQNFITDKGNNLPYNPEDRLLVVTSQYGDVYKSGDTIRNETGADLELFFSDGSVSLLSPGTVLTLSDLDFPKGNNLISKVNLFLQAGSIWTKATKLDNESSFDIYTSDMTASVRGTVFKVEITTEGRSEITVLEGKVEVFSGNENIGKTPIDTIEVIELPSGDLENPKKIDSVVKIINSIPSPTINDVSNIGFSNSIINITIEEDVKEEISINKIISEKHEPKDCYLESIEVKNNDYIQAYKEKNSNNCELSINKINRQCINGVLNGNNDYKYSSCSEPNKCPTTYDGQYVGVNQVGDLKTVNRQENITGGTKEITRTLTCESDLQYDHIDTPGNVTCDTINGFIANNINGTCNCSVGASIQLVGGVNKCVATCVSGIYIGGACQDSEDSLAAIEYDVINSEPIWDFYAYMPYNNAMDFKMYKNNNTTIEPNYLLSALQHTTRASTSILDNNWNWGGHGTNFYTKGNIKGIYLDNVGASSTDYLKYPIGFDQYTDYSIEIDAKGLNRSGKFYLFETHDGTANPALSLYIYNGKLFILSDVIHDSLNKWKDVSSYNGNHKIIIQVINSEKKIRVYLDGVDITSSYNNVMNTRSKSMKIIDLYIGSTKTKTLQWNDFIDYVKIYKK